MKSILIVSVLFLSSLSFANPTDRVTLNNLYGEGHVDQFVSAVADMQRFTNYTSSSGVKKGILTTYAICEKDQSVISGGCRSTDANMVLVSSAPTKISGKRVLDQDEVGYDAWTCLYSKVDPAKDIAVTTTATCK